MTDVAKRDVLQAEIDWFWRAYANSSDKGYHSEYRAGFRAAIGWLELHRDMAQD